MALITMVWVIFLTISLGVKIPMWLIIGTASVVSFNVVASLVVVILEQKDNY